MNEPWKRRRQRQRNLLRAEQGVEQLLGDDRAADRHQDLPEMLAVDRLDDQPLEDEAERAADDAAASKARHEAARLRASESALDQPASGSSTRVAT